MCTNNNCQDQGCPNHYAEREESAKDFAFITHAARDMAETMQRTFKVRIKGSTDLSWAIVMAKEEQALLIGKWIEVQIVWNEDYPHFTLKREGSWMRLMFTEEEFLKHITQVGDAPKMLTVWKLWRKAIGK